MMSSGLPKGKGWWGEGLGIGDWRMRFVCAKSLQSGPTLCDPMDCSPPGSSVHGDSPGKNTGMCCHALLHGIFPTQESNSGLQHCRWILLPNESPGKPKNAVVGSLSLLQGIFPTQDSNQGLLHCRRILYQLSNQESPTMNQVVSNLQRFRKLTC